MILFTSLALAAFGALADAARPGVTAFNFQRLSEGMTVWEAERLFGEAGEPFLRMSRCYFRVWHGKNCVVCLLIGCGHRIVEGECRDIQGKKLLDVPETSPIVVKLINLLAVASYRTGGKVDQPGVTRDNFRRLAIGMSVQQVEQAFGTPGTPYPLASSLGQKTWDGEDICVHLYFNASGELIQGSFWDYAERHRKYLRHRVSGASRASRPPSKFLNR